MFPVRDSAHSRQIPIVTYTLIALNVFIFLWDRNWNPFGQSMVFNDLTMKPNEVVWAIKRVGEWKATTTLFTSAFMHANLTHLFGNMLFLFIFGDNVEAALGGPRYILYYLFWAFAAAFAHIFVMSSSAVPLLGASGAIGGVLGAYFLLFPTHRITLMFFPFVWIQFEVAAWIMLGLWFVWQILFPQAGVANWAHVGGFLAGMMTVLVGGGRLKLLKGKEQLFEEDPQPA